MHGELRVLARFQKRPKRLGEVTVHHLDADDDVEVLGGAEWQTRIGEEQIAGGGANQHIMVSVVSEVSLEPARAQLPLHALQDIGGCLRDAFIGMIPELCMQ